MCERPRVRSVPWGAQRGSGARDPSSGAGIHPAPAQRGGLVSGALVKSFAGVPPPSNLAEDQVFAEVKDTVRVQHGGRFNLTAGGEG